MDITLHTYVLYVHMYMTACRSCLESLYDLHWECLVVADKITPGFSLRTCETGINPPLRLPVWWTSIRRGWSAGYFFIDENGFGVHSVLKNPALSERALIYTAVSMDLLFPLMGPWITESHVNVIPVVPGTGRRWSLSEVDSTLFREHGETVPGVVGAHGETG